MSLQLAPALRLLPDWRDRRARGERAHERHGEVRPRRDAPAEAWYNIAADLPEPPPPALHPGTGQPIGPDDLAPLFPMALIMQEVSTERAIEIPEEVRDVYRQWRPTPLFRARRLEQALDTPAHIYYKYEGVTPAGSHKPNTAVPQAYYNKQEGVKRLTTETGAGQWGSALAFAGAFFGLEVEVYMVQGLLRPEAVPARADGDLRRARASPSPSRGDQRRPRDPRRAPGLDRQPRHRDLARRSRSPRTRDDTKYALGSRAEPRAACTRR